MKQQWQLAFRFLGIGWFLAISILLGVLGGLWLDSKLGTRPVFLITGIFLGLATAGYGAYQMFKPFIANNQGKGD
jgi:ATP synthase protein I